MSRTRIVAGRAVIVIEAQDLVDKTLRRTQTNLHRFANSVGAIGDNLFRTGFFASLASGGLLTGFTKFDDMMRTLRVNLDLFGKSAQQVDRVMKPLERTIRELAKTTPFSPQEVAEAAVNLAKGGFEATQIRNSLKGVLDLSRATRTDLAFTAEFIVRTMTTFGLSTEKTGEVVSQLVRATRKGTLGIDDLEAAMRYSSGTATTLGVSLERMLALFTLLSNKGLVGSIGGTSLNTAFAQLVKKAEDLEKEFGVGLVVSGAGDTVDVLSTLQRLFEETSKLPIDKQVATFQKIFNLRGSRPVAALRTVEEIKKVLLLSNSIKQAGDEAAVAARIMDEGLGGAIRRLVSSVQDLAASLPEKTKTALIGITNALTELVERFNSFAQMNPTLMTLIIFSPAALLGSAVALLTIAKSARVLAGALGLVRATLLPVSRLLAVGFANQISSISNLPQQVTKAGASLKSLASAAKGISIPAVVSSPAGTNVGAATRNIHNARAAALTARADKQAAAAVARRNTATAKLADRTRQVNAALARNNELLKINGERIRAAAIADGQRAARDSAMAARNRAVASLRSLEADRERIQTTIRSGSRTRHEMEYLRFLEEAKSREIALTRETLKRIKVPTVPIGSPQRDELPKRLRQRNELMAKNAKLTRLQGNMVKGAAGIQANYNRNVLKVQNTMLAANSRRARAAAVAVQGVASAGNLVARGGGGIITFFSTLGKTLWGATRTILRFTFSWNGVMFALEGLLLFGKYIPGISTILERFGNAFISAFTAIGRTISYVMGPWELFKASISAFAAGRSDLGIKGLKTAFSDLVGIIGNQLSTAWLRFKQSLGSVWGIIKQIGLGIWNTFTGLFAALEYGIRGTVEAIGYQWKSIFGENGLSFEAGAEGISRAVQAVSDFFLKAIYKFIGVVDWLSQIFEDLKSSLAKIFTYGAGELEAAIRSGLFGGVGAQAARDRAAEKIDEIQAQKEERRAVTEPFFKEFKATINELINANAEARRNFRLEGIDREIARRQDISARLSENSRSLAEEIRMYLAQASNQIVGTEDQPRSQQQQLAQVAAARKMGLQMVAALTGSAASTRGNVLRFPKIEQQQLDVLKSIDTNIKKGLDNEGVFTFAP